MARPTPPAELVGVREGESPEEAEVRRAEYFRWLEANAGPVQREDAGPRRRRKGRRQ